MSQVMKDLNYAADIMAAKFDADSATKLGKQLLWLFQDKHHSLKYEKFIQIINFGALGEYGPAKVLSIQQINLWLRAGLAETRNTRPTYEPRPGDINLEQLRKSMSDEQFKREYPALYAIYVEGKELKIGMKL
jgi:hypothetical protein